MSWARGFATGLSSLRDRAAARLASSSVNPSRIPHCLCAPVELTPNGVIVRDYAKRVTGRTISVEQTSDLIAIVESHCTTMPPETICERCLK